VILAFLTVALKEKEVEISFENKVPRFLKRLVQLSGLIGIAAGGAMFKLENSFLWHPKIPQPDAGMTVPYPFKGAVFYITSSEYLWIKTIHIIFFIAWGVGAVCMYFAIKKAGFPIRGEKLPPRL
jgi:hypothetical protein